MKLTSRLNPLIAAIFLAGLLGIFHPAWADGAVESRYLDHQNGTVTDSKTGLMWNQQDSYLQTGHWLSWPEAFDYVKKLNETGYGGHFDWRVPTLEELKSIYEPDKKNGKQLGREMTIHLDPVFTPNGAGAAWAMEDNGHFNAFGIVFNTGHRFSAAKSSKTRKSTRAVRGSQHSSGK